GRARQQPTAADDLPVGQPRAGAEAGARAARGGAPGRQGVGERGDARDIDSQARLPARAEPWPALDRARNVVPQRAADEGRLAPAADVRVPHGSLAALDPPHALAVAGDARRGTRDPRTQGPADWIHAR